MPFAAELRKRLGVIVSLGPGASPLSRPERLALYLLVGAAFLISLALIVLSGGSDLLSSLFQLALTLVFLLFVRWPWLAVLLLTLALGAMFAFRLEAVALVPFAVAAGLVVRVGGLPLITTYVAVLLLATAAAASGIEGVGDDSARIAAFPLAAVLSAAVGLVLRLAFSREQRLGVELAERAQAEDDARRAERQRIADDLHDVIAHDLTVIAMHARVLERAGGSAASDESLSAIGDAARKALSDLRRVVQQDEVVELQGLAGGSDLEGAFDAARRELLGLEVPVEITGQPDDPRLPRLVSSTLARILRESVTNILKHGGTGPVRIRLEVIDGLATLEVRNALVLPHRAKAADSGGYGTVRMAERATRMGGTYSAERHGDEWIVAVRLPFG